MTNSNSAVIRETKYILFFTLALSIPMQAIFIVLKNWDVTVLLGNLLSGGFAVLNFYLMGKTVEKAVQKEEKEARVIIRKSQSLRQLMLFVVVGIGALVPIFNIWTSIIPLLFPRISIALRPLFGNK